MKSTLMAKALSSVIPSTLFVILMLVLTFYYVNMLTSSFSSMLRIANSISRQEYVITINSVAVYTNGTLVLILYNSGATAIPRVSELDVVVVYTDGLTGRELTYALKPGFDWYVEKVCINNQDICSSLGSDRLPLRPGETAVLRGVLRAPPSIGSWGSVVVITPTGWRAEKAFVVGGVPHE